MRLKKSASRKNASNYSLQAIEIDNNSKELYITYQSAPNEFDNTSLFQVICCDIIYDLLQDHFLIAIGTYDGKIPPDLDWLIDAVKNEEFADSSVFFEKKSFFKQTPIILSQRMNKNFIALLVMDTSIFDCADSFRLYAINKSTYELIKNNQMTVKQFTEYQNYDFYISPGADSDSFVIFSPPGSYDDIIAKIKSAIEPYQIKVELVKKA